MTNNNDFPEDVYWWERYQWARERGEIFKCSKCGFQIDNDDDFLTDDKGNIYCQNCEKNIIGCGFSSRECFWDTQFNLKY